MPVTFLCTSWNRHFTVAEGFGCHNDLRSYVVGGCLRGILPWFQAWGRGPVGLSPKRRHGSVLMWAHPPQEEPWRSGSMWIWWQSKVGALAVQSLIAEDGYWNTKCYLSGGEGTWACARGRPNFNALFWNQSSWEGLDFFLCLSCLRWEEESRHGLLNSSLFLYQFVGVYAGERKGCFPGPSGWGMGPDCGLLQCTK